MTNNYFDTYRNVFLQLKSHLVEKLEAIKKRGLPNSPINILATTSSSLRGIAVGEYLYEKNISKMKNYFYNTAYCLFLVMRWADTHNERSSFVSMANYYELLSAIICDNTNLINVYAQNMGGRGDADKSGIANSIYNIGYSLKYIVLDAHDKAKRYIDDLKKDLTTRTGKHYIGYDITFEGIVEKDCNKFNDGIQRVMANQKKINDYKNTENELFFIPAVAFVKLARNKGLDVSFEHELVPADVIERHKIDYELVDILKLIDEKLQVQ